MSSDDQVKAYIKKIMSQLDRWMVGGKISKLVIVITNKDTGEHVERWQFDVSSPVLSISYSITPNTSSTTGPNLQERLQKEELIQNSRPRKRSCVCPTPSPPMPSQSTNLHPTAQLLPHNQQRRPKPRYKPR